MSTLDETRLAEALGPEPDWANMPEEECKSWKGIRLGQETKVNNVAALIIRWTLRLINVVPLTSFG